MLHLAFMIMVSLFSFLFRFTEENNSKWTFFFRGLLLVVTFSFISCLFFSFLAQTDRKPHRLWMDEEPVSRLMVNLSFFFKDKSGLCFSVIILPTARCKRLCADVSSYMKLWVNIGKWDPSILHKIKKYILLLLLYVLNQRQLLQNKWLIG